MEGQSPNLFGALRDLLLPYKADLLVVHDEDDHFYANCRNVDAKGKAQFFGAGEGIGSQAFISTSCPSTPSPSCWPASARP